MNKLVSVILTIYNNPVGLISSLNSALNQSYKNLEILVVDGGHNKYTMTVVDMFKDKRITYIKVGDGRMPSEILKDESDNRICGNVQYCRNIGVQLSQGKYVATLDDDDMWHKYKIERQVNVAEYYNASLVCCQTIKTIGETWTIDKPPHNPTFSDLLQAFNYSQTSAYFMNKKDLVECGGFNEELRSMHEYDVALRMANLGMKIITLHRPFLYSKCSNASKREYYFIKIAELLDLWRYYGEDMLRYLNRRQFFINIIKTVALMSLYVAGYIIKEKVWRVVFKLKEWYQRC